MSAIRIMGPVEDILGPHPLSTREAFIGLIVEADGQAVTKLRETHPGITRIPNTYEVALADALETLILNGRDEAAGYWGDTVRPYLIYVPHGQAVLATSTDPGK